MNTSLGIIITSVEIEKTLHEYKKEIQEYVKKQSEIRKVITKDNILKIGEAAEQIKSRHKEEMWQVKLQSILKEKRGKVR